MRWKCSRFVLLAGSLVLAACGGGGGSSTTTGTATVTDVVNVPGAWSGNYQLSSASSATDITAGAVTSDGFGYFADNNGYVFVLDSLPGTSPFSAAMTGFAPPGQTFANGFSTVNFLVSGSYAPSGSGISVQATLGENDNDGTLTGSINLTSSTPFSGTSALSALQGQWSGFYIGRASTSASLSINGTNGAITGNDGYGCTLSGSLTQAAPGTNLYYVTLNSTGTGCAGTLDGLAYEGSADTSGVFGGAAGTYLYVSALGPNTAYVMELKI